MCTNSFSSSTENTIRSVMRNHELAKFGDALANFSYSLAKTKVLGVPFGERVFDKALAESLRQADLRPYMPSSVSSGTLGDGVEALVGYVFLEKILSIEEIVAIISAVLSEKKEEDFGSRTKEKRIMTDAFYAVLEEIKKKLAETK